MFPNPTYSSIRVVSVLPVRTLVVYDLAGRIVKTVPEIAESGEVSLDELPAGLYSAVFTLGQSVVVKRVIKRQ